MESQQIVGEAALATGCYYTTLFQWFIMVFGWELFLITACTYPDRFAHTVALFAELTNRRYRHWIDTWESPIFCTHDDIAITRGLVFRPAWYRTNLWPHYERNFDVLKQAGKKIIFTSDGNYTAALDDLATLGVDGFVIDPTMDLTEIVRRYGKTKVLAGNISTRLLTLGTPEDVVDEVRRCADIGRDAPGYFFRPIGDLPHNIPLENIKAYYGAIKEFGRRH